MNTWHFWTVLRSPLQISSHPLSQADWTWLARTTQGACPATSARSVTSRTRETIRRAETVFIFKLKTNLRNEAFYLTRKTTLLYDDFNFNDWSLQNPCRLRDLLLAKNVNSESMTTKGAFLWCTYGFILSKTAISKGRRYYKQELKYQVEKNHIKWRCQFDCFKK